MGPLGPSAQRTSDIPGGDGGVGWMESAPRADTRPAPPAFPVSSSSSRPRSRSWAAEVALRPGLLRATRRGGPGIGHGLPRRWAHRPARLLLRRRRGPLRRPRRRRSIPAVGRDPDSGGPEAQPRAPARRRFGGAALGLRRGDVRTRHRDDAAIPGGSAEPGGIRRGPGAHVDVAAPSRQRIRLRSRSRGSGGSRPGGVRSRGSPTPRVSTAVWPMGRRIATSPPRGDGWGRRIAARRSWAYTTCPHRPSSSPGTTRPFENLFGSRARDRGGLLDRLDMVGRAHPYVWL